MEKLLTIVIPSYNVEPYLRKGLDTMADSRLKETLEVLIINDGSSDDTPGIAREYEKKYPEIFRLINKENGGHGSVINTGIKEAAGRYFRIIDGDDWVITDNLVKLIKKLAGTDADIIADKKSEIDMTTLKGELISLPKSALPDKIYDIGQVFEMDDMMQYFMIHIFSIKTQLLRDHNISVLEKVFYEDSEYVLKSISIAKSVQFIDLEIYQYMVGNVNQSVSTINFVKRYGNFDAVTKEMLKFSQDHHNAFVTSRVRNVILTQYYIALIYNTDRKQGAKWAKELNAYLKLNYKFYYRLTRGRYRLDQILHALGFDYEKLQKLRKLLGKN